MIRRAIPTAMRIARSEYGHLPSDGKPTHCTNLVDWTDAIGRESVVDLAPGGDATVASDRAL